MYDPDSKVRVLFVCTGNICRSPAAEGVFRALIEREGLAHRIAVDSAGTTGYHVGDPPDSRTVAIAAQRGFDLSSLRARRVRAEDFLSFDLIVAMDSGHFQTLSRMAPDHRQGTVDLFLRHAPEVGITDVPDPYYGGEEGFDRVMDMIEAGSRGLLQHIRTTILKMPATS